MSLAHTTFAHRLCGIFALPGRVMQEMREGLVNQKLTSAPKIIGEQKFTEEGIDQ